jgi:surface polysaccharide O-acyltransferase-like enzyme
MMIYWINSARALACIAVVVIHVSADFVGGKAYGLLSFSDWMTGNVIDSMCRWAVPVFILLTGALLIKENFDLKYYLRRLLKVVLPFLAWSVLYCFYTSTWGVLSGDFHFNSDGFFSQLLNIPVKRAYFHLEFFYYFIPLYFVIPFIFPLLDRIGDERGKFVICLVVLLTLCPLVGIDSVYLDNTFVYSLYLIVGFYFSRKAYSSVDKHAVAVFLLSASVIAMGTYCLAEANEAFVPLYYDNKILPVFLCAISVLGFSRKYLDFNIATLSTVSKYSLGIYLIHPMVMGYGARYLSLLDGLGALGAILMKSLLVFLISLAAIAALSKARITRWLVP